jgi:acyl-CoA synthetase (AMP-forming)/AMP-acid ligase II/acyl carrier protein
MVAPCLIYEKIYTLSQNNLGANAILSPGKRVLSYRDLSQFLHNISLELVQIGILSSDRLAVVMPNGPDMATAFLAVSAVCACVPLNPSYPLEDYEFAMKDLGVKALMTSFGKDHPSCQAADKLGLPVLQTIPDEQSSGIFKLVHHLPIDKTIEKPVFGKLDDKALVLHTSGTTARPKIVSLTHRNIFYSVNNIADSYALNPTDRCLNMMPLFHIHGLIGAVATSLYVGASVICAPGFLAEGIVDWLSELAPTWYTAVPTIHQAVLEAVQQHPETTKKISLRFIRSCSSSLAPQLAGDLERIFSTPVLEAYGMTEATHQMASNPLPPSSHKFGSVGLPTGTTRISILDDNGHPLDPFKVGEICIQGENVITGYENNAEANQTNFINGWLRTGDRGYIDEDGYLFIRDRLKELINRGGEKISPKEIDETLLQHPAVKQAVAFAIPHPSLGEDIAAAVVLKPDKTISMHELRQFAADKLADYKVPRLIVFVKNIPKGATGKIQRIGLGEKLKDEINALRLRETTSNLKPRNPTETKLLSIWQQVLAKNPIGIDDDFLALGGDSIMAARILMQVEEEFHVTFSMREIFNVPTIASMSELILQTQKHAKSK